LLTHICNISSRHTKYSKSKHECRGKGKNKWRRYLT
jgi:hypothetical protein